MLILILLIRVFSLWFSSVDFFKLQALIESLADLSGEKSLYRPIIWVLFVCLLTGNAISSMSCFAYKVIFNSNLTPSFCLRFMLLCTLQIKANLAIKSNKCHLVPVERINQQPWKHHRVGYDLKARKMRWYRDLVAIDPLCLKEYCTWVGSGKGYFRDVQLKKYCCIEMYIFVKIFLWMACLICVFHLNV